ncbi:MAG: hypothetical protein FWE84_03620 [Firmicutes bacterium]|nr:hypothetical protein [Bacillota bacterium]
MKRKLLVVAILPLLFAACVIVGCGEKSNTITFVNYDGALLLEVPLEEGVTPQYTGETPEKPSDAEFDYTFSGWKLTKPTEYTAQYTSKKRSYTISFEYESGVPLQSKTLEYGVTPSYTGPSPVKESTVAHDYKFAGWEPEIAVVTGPAVYVARFEIGKSYFQGGSGAQDDPYIIATAEQLKNFADTTNDNKSADDTYYALGADINLNGEEWTPIGSHPSWRFRGVFDGRNYKVHNFKITGARRYSGLFGYIRGSIINLGVENFTIDVGSTPNTSGGYDIDIFAGGMVGYSDRSNAETDDYYGRITNCYAAGGSVTVNAYSVIADAGGLIGTNDRGTITGCYAAVDVILNMEHSFPALSTVYAGGLLGNNSRATMNDCYATGNVSASVSAAAFWVFAGGLVAYNSGWITNGYAAGGVSVDANTVGSSATASSGYAGGVAGQNIQGGGVDPARINNCFATCNISMTVSASPTVYAGGVTGNTASGASVNNCHRYDGQTFSITRGAGSPSANPTNTLGGACTLTQLNSPTFYSGTLNWSAQVWNIAASDLDFDGGKLPTLKR